MAPESVDQVSAALGYRFARTDLLTQALTHRSAGEAHNERLEFLGDALVNLVAGSLVYSAYPGATEGELSRLRARLVNQAGLVRVAERLQLGSALVLGEGEIKTGGGNRPSILADAVEALAGAVYLDGGFEPCYRVLAQLFGPEVEGLPSLDRLKDAKTRLQERLQARQLALPHYSVIDVSGPPHAQHFAVRCEIEGVAQSFHGEGSTRRRAEQEAAERALEALDE